MLRILSIFLVVFISTNTLSAQCSSFSWEPAESNGYDLFSDHPQLSEFGGNPMWTITLNGGSSFELDGATIHLNPNQLAEIGSNGAEVCFTWGEANIECSSQTCLTLVYQNGQLSILEEPTCEALFMISSIENGEVTFENMSTGSNETTIYNWNFGDELGIIDETSPTHVFNYSGPRQVCLNMINYEGDEPVCSSTYCTTINVELQEITCEPGTYPVTVSVATCCEAPYQNSAVFSFWNQDEQYNYFNAIGLAPFEAVASHSFCIPEGCYYVQFDYSLMEQAAEQIADITVTSPNTTSFTIVELWEGLYWDLEMCFGETNPCNHEIIVSEGSCGEMLFELTNFPQFGNVNWTFGDETQSGGSGSATHFYDTPGIYEVCAEAWSGECQDGYLVCTEIVIESCESDCPTAIYGMELECGYYSFNIGNVQLGEAFWNFGDGETYDGTPWAQHNYTENGVYVVTATYYSQNCPEGVTLNYTVIVDCGSVVDCPSEIWSGAGEDCGVINFEIGNFVQGEAVTWFPGDDSGAVVGGHFFSHTYSEPGTYTVCAFYTTPNCPDGVELCKTINVANCESDCPAVIYATELECGYFSFNIGNVQQGEAMWNFGDDETYDGTPWAQHNYTEDGVYVVTATYYGPNCTEGVTLVYTVNVDCGNVVECPSEIWSGAGEECGVMNFEIGSFVQGEEVTWFPGDDSGAVVGGHFFSHTYSEPGTYTVCAFYTTPNCPDGVELCKTINVANCESDCPAVIYANEFECGNFSFNIGNVQQGEAMWNFGDGETYDGTPWTQHNYTEDGVYVVTATYHSLNCLEGVTLVYTVNVDCGNVVECPSEIWSGAGEDCGVMNFEIGNFVQGEEVTWFPGDDSGAVVGGHFFSHIYSEPGTYEVCAFYTSPNCPNGVELCKTITVEPCENPCHEISLAFTCNANTVLTYSIFNTENQEFILTNTTNQFNNENPYDNALICLEDGCYTLVIDNDVPVEYNGNVFISMVLDGVNLMENAELLFEDQISFSLQFGVNSDCSLPECEASFTPIYTNTPGHVEFINNSTYAGEATFVWTYGNESTSATNGGNVWYDENGLYEVCLTMTTTSNCTDVFCMPVSIQNMATGCSGTEVNITVTGDISEEEVDAISCLVSFEGMPVGNWPLEITSGFETTLDVCIPTGCYELELVSELPVQAQNILAEIGIGEEIISTLQLLSGNINSNMVFGVNSACTVESTEISTTDYVVYPNPTNNVINIKSSSESKNTEIKIFDMTGQLVYNAFCNASLTTIDVQQLSSGMYLLSIQNDGSTHTHRIEIMK